MLFSPSHVFPKIQKLLLVALKEPEFRGLQGLMMMPWFVTWFFLSISYHDMVIFSPCLIFQSPQRESEFDISNGEEEAPVPQPPASHVGAYVVEATIMSLRLP